MSDTLTRRELLRTGAVLAGAAAAGLSADPTASAQQAAAPRSAGGPLAIISGGKVAEITKAMDLLRAGGDPLDAAIEAVAMVEANPSDHTVGLGGLPNEDGVVELDASVMHGPTHKAGAVAALRNIRHPSRVAALVMRRTDHVLLVGDGALRFARAHGFPEEELLTDEARRIWLDWKERHSDDDDWLPPATAPAEDRSTTRPRGQSRVDWREAFTYGTVNCLALTASGDLGGVTTTSGLSYKIAGRVGDSPIIGAGLYVDNQIGAAGSTGRGEANLQNCSSFAIVELIGRGMSPEEACLAQLRRVAGRSERRLLDATGRPTFGLVYYAISKDGRFGAASITAGPEFTVHDGRTARVLESAGLYPKA